MRRVPSGRRQSWHFKSSYRLDLDDGRWPLAVFLLLPKLPHTSRHPFTQARQVSILMSFHISLLLNMPRTPYIFKDFLSHYICKQFLQSFPASEYVYFLCHFSLKFLAPYMKISVSFWRTTFLLLRVVSSLREKLKHFDVM